MNFNKNKNKLRITDVSLSSDKNLKLNKFIFKKKKSVGKGLHGILLRHRGGGAKKKFRLINYHQENRPYRILGIHYDPYRTTFLNLIQYKDGSLSYKLSQSTAKINLFVNNSDNKIYEGNTLTLHQIPAKSLICNLEAIPGKKALIARSAGSFCKIFKKSEKTAEIILPSKEKKVFSLDCTATVGINSNSHHKFNKKYKAGNNRHRNLRPSVRGVAMNPVDHPHGGGEGKTSGGRPSVSLWGKLTKNVPTRKKKK